MSKIGKRHGSAERKSKKGPAPFRLNPSDVSWEGTASRSPRRSRVRQPRSLDVSSFSFVVTHHPTGIRIEAHLPEGRYSRKQVQDFKVALMTQLEKAVSKKLAR